MSMADNIKYSKHKEVKDTNISITTIIDAMRFLLPMPFPVITMDYGRSISFFG